LIEDEWTDPLLRPYEGLWAAGIQDNGKYRSFCVGQLSLKQVNANSAATTIQKRLETLYIDQVPIRIAYLVGDSATVNLVMMRIFNDNTKKENSFVPCAAHAFNNMMEAVWGIVRVRMS
jgi:hypothetical protein